jgi:Fe-S cluster biogenesis protein NfuA
MSLVPIHPEAVPDAPDALRWMMPAGTLDFVGEPSTLPAPLQDLYDDGILAAPLVVEPSAVVLRIAAGRSWRAEGATVRRVLQAALLQPGDWGRPVDAAADDVLRSVAQEVLAGEVGEFVQGHGGRIEILDVADGRVTIELSGACAGCPASGVTVQRRFESAVRRRCPQLRDVVARERPGRRGGLFGLLPLTTLGQQAD